MKMKLDKIGTAKHNISRLVHTKPRGFNEKAVLKDLGMPTFSRKDALNVLLEILNVVVKIEKRRE